MTGAKAEFDCLAGEKAGFDRLAGVKCWQGPKWDLN